MPFLEVPKCYEIYVHHDQKPARLIEFPANQLTILLGENLSEQRKPKLIRCEAVFDAFGSLQSPNNRNRFPGRYVIGKFGELKNEWKELSWNDEPPIATFVERSIEEAYSKIQFPRGNLNSVDELLIAGMDYGTTAYQGTKETLQRMMSGINFVLLSSYSYPK